MNDHMYNPIDIDFLASAQFNDRLCTEVRRRLSKGKVLDFEINFDGIVVWTAEAGPEIFVPDSLETMSIRTTTSGLQDTLV